MENVKHLAALRAGVAAIMGALGGIALAQQAAAPQVAAADTSGDKLEDIVVSGIRESMRESIDEKRHASTIMESISTKEIGELPDVTIAEELNRLPGVNTTRDRGNASQASVRGMGPRLVFGLVNGREVASSEPSQDLRWEIYPSEVLTGANVYKAQDASLIPGGIAATIDIRTIAPLEYKGDEFSVRAGPTYNSMGKDLPDYSPWGYRGSAGWIKHVNQDLAFAVAVSAQHEKNGFPDFRTWGWNTPDNTRDSTGIHTGTLSGTTPVNTTWGFNTEVKEVTQDRHAISGAVGWRPAQGITIKGDALYTEYEIKENQFQAWFANNITGNWNNGNLSQYTGNGSTYQVVDGTVVAANMIGSWPNYQSSVNRYDEKHKLAVTGLNGVWEDGDWTHEADVSYSHATRKNQWQAIYLDTQMAATASAANFAYNVADGSVPWAALPGFNPADPSQQAVSTGNWKSRVGESDGPETTTDRLAALALSTTRTLHDSAFTDIKVGARYSGREKDHSNNKWFYCPGSGSSSTNSCPLTNYYLSLANAGLSQFSMPGISAPPMVYGNFDTLFPLVYPNSAQPSGTNIPLQQTTVRERSVDAYVMTDFQGKALGTPFTGNVGLRVSNVQTESNGFQTYGASFTPVSVSNSYTSVLPSANLTFNLSQTDLLRLAASVGVSRPPLDALVTGYTLSTVGNPLTAGGGNPLLKPYKADQLDVSYESYFHPESMYALAGYLKHLTNTIAAGQSWQTINGTPYYVTDESNRSGGNIFGLEATFQTRFHFLPGFWRDFGVYMNHAWVTSNIKEAAPVSNPYPMVGLARGTSEFDVFYDKDGFESRIALKHHTQFTIAPTWVATSLKGLSPETILDASVSYAFDKHWSVRLQGHNLTNQAARMSTDNNTQNLANDGGYQIYGRSYLFDVAFKF